MTRVKSNSKDVLLILGHIGLGALLFSIPPLSKYFGYFFTIFGVYKIVNSKNTGIYSAHFFAAYSIGVEMMMRMARSTIVWEYGKLAIVIFCFTGLVVERLRKDKPTPIIIYLLCLLPSIVFIYDADLSKMYYSSKFELFTYNLSGPIALAFSAIYFYRRKMTINEFKRISYWLLMPLITVLVFIMFKEFSYGTIEFNYSANAYASGGFGPNQVATILGLGMLIIGFSFIFNYQIFFSKYFDVFLFILLFYRCLLTFSRGGLITPLISIILMLLFISLYYPKRFFNLRTMGVLIVGVIIGIFFLIKVNEKTGGFLEERYQGNTQDTKYTGKKILLNGRDRLFLADLQIFTEHPIVGTGLGLAQIRRAELAGFSATSHSELTRMISEHGLYGVFALLMIIYLPWKEFRLTRNYYNRALLIGCISFAFISISHSGMRTCSPSFIYGLAFVNIISTTVRKQITIKRMDAVQELS